MIFKEYEDYQNKCRKKWGSKAYFIQQISLKNVFNWHDSTIELNAPIIIITGKNGVGKSTCINAIHYVFHIQQIDRDDGILSSIKDSEICLSDRKGKKTIINNGKITKNDFSLPIVIDLTFNSKLYSFFKNSTSFDRLTYIATLQQFDSLPLPGHLLSYLQEFVEKRIKTAERIIDLGDLEDFDEQEGVELTGDEEIDEVFDKNTLKEYYRITLEDGTIYDSYSMGSGEFYVNQFLWGLNDLNAGSIVIIEELENYLHSGVQKKLIELIHKTAHEEHIQFILTSHSPTIIDHVSRDSLILIKFENSNIKSICNCPNWLAKDDLGTTIQNKKIVCVEDEKGKSFLESIISFDCPSLSHQIEIICCKGDSKIIDFIDTTNSLDLSNFIGVVDGDYSIEEYERVHRKKFPKHILKLPGSKPPEIIVVNEVHNHLQDLSDILYKPIPVISEAIDSSMTILDFHEWISAIAYKLGENPNLLWESMVKIWYKYNREPAANFFMEFYKEFMKQPV